MNFYVFWGERERERKGGGGILPPHLSALRSPICAVWVYARPRARAWQLLIGDCNPSTVDGTGIFDVGLQERGAPGPRRDGQGAHGHLRLRQRLRDPRGPRHAQALPPVSRACSGWAHAATEPPGSQDNAEILLLLWDGRPPPAARSPRGPPTDRRVGRFKRLSQADLLGTPEREHPVPSTEPNTNTIPARMAMRLFNCTAWGP